ncbi:MULTISPECIES: hypothetical protein [Lacrimispora]|uniref:hypothetical protein n=1 Tax=Lacrimispora TaxID=2719231 RepID=UPI00045E8AFF|nr:MULTISPECIES: hypothetical protein [Lacrimispora]
MKYFILSEQEENNPNPDIKNWFGKITSKDNSEQFDAEKSWILLDSKLKADSIYMDILTFPCIFVSEKVMKVIWMYRRGIKAIKIILIDPDSQNSLFYYLPELPEHRLLSMESTFDKTKSRLLKGSLDKNKIQDIPFFILGEVSKATLVIREDVAESLIRRNVRGIKLQELLIV